MSFSVNKQTILGRIGSVPELRYTQSGKAVTDVSVAASEKYKGVETTEWFKVTVWSPLAEILVNYGQKGDRVYFEGRTETEEYTDRDGNKRKSTKVVAREMVLLGREVKRDQQASAPSGGSGGGYGGGYSGGGSAKHTGDRATTAQDPAWATTTSPTSSD